MKTARTTNRALKSFSVELEDLHCTIHFLFLNKKTHGAQVKSAIADLRKQKFDVNEKVEKMIDDVFLDCKPNPGFTFELTDTEIAIGIRPDIAYVGTDYFIGLLTHEITHAVNFVMVNLGLMLEDDELRAIVTGNVVETAMKRLKLDYKLG